MCVLCNACFVFNWLVGWRYRRRCHAAAVPPSICLHKRLIVRAAYKRVVFDDHCWTYLTPTTVCVRGYSRGVSCWTEMKQVCAQGRFTLTQSLQAQPSGNISAIFIAFVIINPQTCSSGSIKRLNNSYKSCPLWKQKNNLNLKCQLDSYGTQKRNK